MRPELLEEIPEPSGDFFFGRSMGYLLFSAAVTWIGGILMGRVKVWKKKAVLTGALLLNLGLLCSLKYEGFLSAEAGIHLPWGSVFLPLGISFYVFQTTAYLVDTFRGTVSPEKNPLKYLLFVSFFPQIVQGPIGRWNPGRKCSGISRKRLY